MKQQADTSATFYIRLNVKTPAGFESYAQFYIGHDRKTATALFSQLKGSEELDEKNILQLDLTELSGKLPVNIRVLSCTLDQITENCKIISREIFRQMNLKGISG